jgi:2,3-bisphosphoglycerate-dependent phosphoglycerate mutase
MPKSPPKLVLLRHGESDWNRKNLFTGWVDIPLSQGGVKEALDAGKRISSIPFDVIFVSSLVRAQMTAMLAMTQHTGGKTPLILHPGQGKLEKWAKIYSEESAKTTIPVITAWEINERMYGALQGCNKDEMRKKYGAEQVHIWRRSYDTPPPEGESLEGTAKRSIPYFEKQIAPYLEKGQNVLVSAHGNSLRSIVMKLDNLSREEVLKLEIPTGEPLCYSLVDGKWQKEDVDAVQAAYQKGRG